jgi:hypothetical protein
MTMQITLEVPDQLGEEIKRYQDRLPELLERGLHELKSEEASASYDVEQIMDVLASQPTPEQILSIQPSQPLQARMTHLLQKNKAGSLSRGEEAEMERYLMLEHLVRLAKATALQQKAGK